MKAATFSHERRNSTWYSKVREIKIAALKLFLLPDLVASRIACITSNVLWSACLLNTHPEDPFSLVMGKILPTPMWSFIFAVLAIGQSIFMLRNRSHSSMNFALVAVQTAVWIFLTVVFYSAFYPGSLILANSILIAFLSSWAFVRFESSPSRRSKRWNDR